MQRSRIAGPIVAAVLSLILAAVPADAIMLVSKSQEISIGKQVEAQAIRDYGGLSSDRALNERVARVGARAAAASPRLGLDYTYKVVNSNEINAFAAPGGPIIITKRLAQMLPTDDELAFVLSHETGHIAAEHGRKAINQALIAQGVATLFMRDSSKAMKTGINVMYTMYSRGYSRKDEYQADELGYRLMTKSGYNAEGAIKALAKLGMKRTSGVNKYFSTHPDIPARIDRITGMAGISEARKQALITAAQAEKPR